LTERFEMVLERVLKNVTPHDPPYQSCSRSLAAWGQGRWQHLKISKLLPVRTAGVEPASNLLKLSL
jgi:hypothetical protein